MAKRDKSESKPVADPRWASGDQFWYRAKVGEPVHTKVVTFGNWLRSLYSAAHQYDRVYERLYEGTELRRNRQALVALSERGFSAAKLNVSESIIDTVVSRLSKQRPMPAMTVMDGQWSTKRKARKFREFVLGEMQMTEFDGRSQEALRDGAVNGNGITRIDDSGDGECVFAERVLREEILFDPRESKYGDPPNCLRLHRIARDRLLEIYPDAGNAIIAAPAASPRPSEELDDDTARTLNLEDYVDVYEAWHLPRRGDDDETGRHVVCIDGRTLLSEQWYERRFPIAMFRYRKPMRGIWSRGLIFKLKDIQHRINSIVRDLQMNLQATGRGFFMQQEGSDLPVEMLTGWQPFNMKYKGNRPPTWQAPQPFNQAQLAALEKFVQYAHDLSGVSQAAASSKSSLGPGASGVALDTQYDIESERFAMQESQYAAYRLEAAQLYIDAAKRVARKRAERKGDKKPRAYVTSWAHRDAIEQLEYDSVALKQDEYRLQLEPVNFLPATRAGKLSAVGQLAQAGVIPQWLTGALFDEPDLEAANRITLGAYWNAERKMELLADPEKPMPMPAPYNDLDLELKMITAYCNYVESEDAPDEVQDRYRQYLTLVTDAVKKKNPPQPPGMPPGMPGGPPPGGPGGIAGPAAMPGAQPMLPPGAPMPQAA